MQLKTIAKGCWSFGLENSSAATSITIVLHARDADGNPCLEPGPELIAAAESTARNAASLRDQFIQRIGCPDPEEARTNIGLPITGFTEEELLNPSEDVIERLNSRIRLLHISVERFPDGATETCGYVVDAWSRVWQVGDGYIEGWVQLESFQA